MVKNLYSIIHIIIVSMYRFTNSAWITLLQGGGGWGLRVKGNLTPRADNGRINSSPIAAIPPLFRLRHGTTHTFTIPGMYEHDITCYTWKWLSW